MENNVSRYYKQDFILSSQPSREVVLSWYFRLGIHVQRVYVKCSEITLTKVACTCGNQNLNTGH